MGIAATGEKVPVPAQTMDSYSGRAPHFLPIAHPTFAVHLDSPIFFRVVEKLCTERGGVGGKVLVQDAQHLGHWLAVADDDLPPVGFRAIVVHI